MKIIFDERQDVGQAEVAGVDERGYNEETGRHDKSRIERRQYDVRAHSLAYWDNLTGVLCVDQEAACWGPDDWEWLPAALRVLETVISKPSAQRRAIALADEWAALVKAAIPARLSDEQVWELHRAGKAKPVEVPF